MSECVGGWRWGCKANSIWILHTWLCFFHSRPLWWPLKIKHLQCSLHLSLGQGSYLFSLSLVELGNCYNPSCMDICKYIAFAYPQISVHHSFSQEGGITGKLQIHFFHQKTFPFKKSLSFIIINASNRVCKYGKNEPILNRLTRSGSSRPGKCGSHYINHSKLQVSWPWIYWLRLHNEE